MQQRARHPLGVVIAEPRCAQTGILGQQPLQRRSIAGVNHLDQGGSKGLFSVQRHHGSLLDSEIRLVLGV